jgi:hypothetical protein
VMGQAGLNMMTGSKRDFCENGTEPLVSMKAENLIS